MQYDLQTELRKRAVHEAGHAVVMWRGSHVGEFNALPPFDEVLISPHALDQDGNLPPLQLADGRLHHNAGGTVWVRDVRQRVPDVRAMTGLPLSQHREWIKRAKAEADAAVVGLLAGPVVEEHFCGDDRSYDWQEGDRLNEDGDVMKAVAIVENELCRGWRQTSRYMDDVVARIEALLDRDPRYLRTIQAVADTLEQRHRLDRFEAWEIMREAWTSDGGDFARRKRSG